MTALAAERLTWAELAPMLRDALKDKTYRQFPLGQDAGHYLRFKRKRLTATSYRDYESILDKLARHFADLEFRDALLSIARTACARGVMVSPRESRP